MGDPIFMIPSNNISRLLLLREIRINEKNSEIKRNQEEKSGLIKIIHFYDSSSAKIFQKKLIDTFLKQKC